MIRTICFVLFTIVALAGCRQFEREGANPLPENAPPLAYTDMVYPQDQMSIYFRAPAAKGRYPYLCTFPGHWMVMNGVMVVE